VSLKIAIGGKGGVGKTTITSLLARCLAADDNNKVIAIDADPVANLAAGLGIPEDKPITPISELTDLIADELVLHQGQWAVFLPLILRLMIFLIDFLLKEMGLNCW
jgi:CO dehydrogenase maturation factor